MFFGYLRKVDLVHQDRTHGVRALAHLIEALWRKLCSTDIVPVLARSDKDATQGKFMQFAT